MTTTNPMSTDAPAMLQRQAFAAIQPELDALADDDLPRVSIDIRDAMVTVLGCAPALATLAGQLPTQLPQVDPELFTKLQRYALALGHAHTQIFAASQPVRPVGELTEQLKEIVERFLADATRLAKRGLIDGERLTLVPGMKGPKSTAASALLLVELFRINWSKLTNKTPVTADELDQAEALANRIETAVGVRDQAAPSAPEASTARIRTYALFVRTHDEVRRVVSFLRWHEGDVDQYAPSIYAARGKRSSGSELRGGEVLAGPQPAEPSAGASTPAGAPGGASAANIPAGAAGVVAIHQRLTSRGTAAAEVSRPLTPLRPPARRAPRGTEWERLAERPPRLGASA